jgi:hypothetical protein
LTRSAAGASTSSAGIFVARTPASAADQFLALCDNAGPRLCALAGDGGTAAGRFDALLPRMKGAPIPAPGASPPLSSRQELSYGDLLLSQFQPLRAPTGWPRNAADLASALGGRRLGARERGEPLPFVRRLGGGGDLDGDAVRGRTGRPELTGVAAGDWRGRADQPVPGPCAGLVAVGPAAPPGRFGARTTIGGPGTQ